MNRRILTILLTCLAVFAVSSAHADRFDEMISPISNPVNFEDPRINTEARFIYLYHEIDDNFVTGGGNAQIYALQLRFAVTEDLAIIATKDGIVDFNPEVGEDETGLGNIAAGVKYAFHKNEDKGTIATAALRYEASTGNGDVFQGHGDGFIQPSVSFGAALCGLNIVAATGLRIAMDQDYDSSFWDVDLHVDKKIGNFYPTLEVNLIQVIDDGERLPIADEGLDYFNFGATDAAGKTIVTGAAGARYRVMDDLDLGAAYQFPLTNGAGSNLFDWRLTTDVILSF